MSKRYIRTSDENNLIIDLKSIYIPYQIVDNFIDFNSQGRYEIVKQSDFIEELCDEFIKKDNEIYGAIWTKSGLKFVAKVIKKIELELII